MNDTKPQYHHGSLREALIENALVFLKSNSVEDLSLRKLAATIGVNQTALYSHFKNKKALLAELAKFGFEDLIKQSVLVFEQGKTAEENLSLFAQYYLTFAIEHPELFKLMFGPLFSELHPESETLWSTAEESFLLFQTVVEDYLKSVSSHTPSKLAVLTVWSFMHGFGHLVIGDRLNEESLAALESGQLLDQLLNVIKSGLKT